MLPADQQTKLEPLPPLACESADDLAYVLRKYDYRRLAQLIAMKIRQENEVAEHSARRAS